MSLILYLLGILALVFTSAQDDYEQIKGDDQINHRRQWLGRLTLAVLFSALVVLFSAVSWWRMIPMLFGAAGLFASLHRLLLNYWTGGHLCYVSPSNWYDWQFMRTQIAWSRADCLAEPNFYENGTSYHNAVHRAGRLAYIAEAIVIAISTFILL